MDTIKQKITEDPTPARNEKEDIRSCIDVAKILRDNTCFD